MVTANPCESLADNSNTSFPLHQPASPQRSQTTCPIISGGKGVGVGEGVLVGVDVGVNVEVVVAVLVEVNVEVVVGVNVRVGVRVGVRVEVNVGVREEEYLLLLQGN
jgi:UDP-3-O-[3-hydroxymyristoyl] glucosamine N-acyltransferase